MIKYNDALMSTFTLRRCKHTDIRIRTYIFDIYHKKKGLDIHNEF